MKPNLCSMLNPPESYWIWFCRVQKLHCQLFLNSSRYFNLVMHYLHYSLFSPHSLSPNNARWKLQEIEAHLVSYNEMSSKPMDLVCFLYMLLDLMDCHEYVRNLQLVNTQIAVTEFMTSKRINFSVWINKTHGFSQELGSIFNQNHLGSQVGALGTSGPGDQKPRRQRPSGGFGRLGTSELHPLGCLAEHITAMGWKDVET